jgi:CheY-like chemotaxis protein
MPAGDYVQISVSDDGTGIAEDIVERVFEPFFTTKGVGHGTGLGLAQVQGFSTQAGGRARLASTPGVGTAVMLLLPAAHSVGGDSRPRQTPAPAATVQDESDRRLQDAHVLLVEDNAELASVTSVLLGAYGCVVEVARSPAQALVLADRGPAFDIVLSDVVMPGDMDGLGLARELRRRYPALPVVLISGYSSALQAAQEFTVLHKPCTPEQLTAALGDALAPAQPQRSADAAD